MVLLSMILWQGQTKSLPAPFIMAMMIHRAAQAYKAPNALNSNKVKLLSINQSLSLRLAIAA